MESELLKINILTIAGTGLLMLLTGLLRYPFRARVAQHMRSTLWVGAMIALSDLRGGAGRPSRRAGRGESPAALRHEWAQACSTGAGGGTDRLGTGRRRNGERRAVITPGAMGWPAPRRVARS